MRHTHWVLILLVCPGLPDVSVVGRGPLILGRTPLLPQNGLSLILLPVQVSPIRQAGSTHYLPEGREGDAGTCIWAPDAWACMGTPGCPAPAYPRLPALDVLRLKDDLCLSCDFMITSCLCFSSKSRTLNSSSSHRSEMAEESVVGGPPGQRSYHPNPLKTPSILWGTEEGEKTMPALFPGLQPNH